MLRVTDLTKTYPTGDKALSGVTVDIEEDEIVAMIGPSGAGKSTFIRCINRLTEPSSGTVALDGTDLTALSKRDLRNARRDIGMVFQEYNLIERLTVMENVLSGRLGFVNSWRAFRRKFPSDDVEKAYETLDRVGLGGFENNRADELSGGQRQRVGIARAVLQNPSIVLADEPTSSLDPETSQDVMELLTEIAREEHIPVLINIHELDLALEHADRILGLSDGELVFDGSPTELSESAKNDIYRGGEPRKGRSESTDTDQTDENVVGLDSGIKE